MPAAQQQHLERFPKRADLRLGSDKRGTHRLPQLLVVPVEKGTDHRISVLCSGMRVEDHAAPAGVLARARASISPAKKSVMAGRPPLVLRQAAERRGKALDVAAQRRAVESCLPPKIAYKLERLSPVAVTTYWMPVEGKERRAAADVGQMRVDGQTTRLQRT